MERPAVIALLAFARIEMNKHPGVPLGLIMPADGLVAHRFSIEQRGNENQWGLKKTIKHYKIIRRTDKLKWTSI
jgi:hypothetical protein